MASARKRAAIVLASILGVLALGVGLFLAFVWYHFGGGITVAVTNVGSERLEEVVVCLRSETGPELLGEWPIGDLAPDETREVTFGREGDSNPTVRFRAAGEVSEWRIPEYVSVHPLWIRVEASRRGLERVRIQRRGGKDRTLGADEVPRIAPAPLTPPPDAALGRDR